MAELKRGDVVKVVKGKSSGAEGKVFWIGQTKFQKTRVGIETASGKVWAAPTEIVNADGSPVVMPAAAMTIDDRVAKLEQQVAVLMAAFEAAKKRRGETAGATAAA